MKKTGILNAELARIVAALGHGDMLVVGDAGLPVPKGVACVDLAVRVGVPGFWEVLDTVLEEMVVERAVIAGEASETLRAEFAARFEAGAVSHEDLKAMSQEAVAVVRTGAAVPYCNVVPVSGVAF